LTCAGGNEDGTAIDLRSNWATLYDNATQEVVGSAHVFAPTFSGSMWDIFLEIKVKRLDYPRFVDINLQVKYVTCLPLPANLQVFWQK
jgi:hypothetical protein